MSSGAKKFQQAPAIVLFEVCFVCSSFCMKCVFAASPDSLHKRILERTRCVDLFKLKVDLGTHLHVLKIYIFCINSSKKTLNILMHYLKNGESYD